jgi:formyl-CoA transferase
MQGVIPRLTSHPGAVWRSGPALGEDTDAVLADYIGMSPEEIAALRLRGVV